MELPGVLFSPSSKNKKKPSRENFLCSNIKKFLIFSQKKAVLIFQGTETPKKFFILSQKKGFLIFWKTEALKKVVYISGNGTFRTRKMEKTCSEKTSYILEKRTF